MREERALREGYILGGRYRILGRTGSGRFCILYKVLDIHLGRPAAVKELFPEGMAVRGQDDKICFTALQTEEAGRLRDAFAGEAARMAVLDETEGLPFVLDSFEENGTVYIVMSYVEGITLREEILMRGRGITPSEAAELLIPLSEVLSDMHAMGIVHRDLSPENVVIRKNGKPCLLDLGSSEDLYMAGLQQRTVNEGYSPYEQYFREGRTGIWTDIYGMGALLYLCLYGYDPPSALKRREGVRLFAGKKKDHPAVRKVIETSMAPEPAARYPSAGAFGDGLREAVRQSRRHSLFLGISATAAACLSLLFLISLPDSFLTVNSAEVVGDYSAEIHSDERQQPVAEEGTVLKGMNGWYEIHSCVDGSLLWAVSQESGVDEPQLILWKQVWDETQRICLKEQEEGVYRISCRRDGGKLYLTAGETKEELYFSGYKDDGQQLFRLISGGKGTCLIQTQTSQVAGSCLSLTGPSAEQGQAVIAAPYDSFPESRAVHWMLERTGENGETEGDLEE